MGKIQDVVSSMDSENVLKESFHNAIRPVIFLAQFFGVMPVTGIKYINPNHLKFNWYSKRNLGSVVFCVCDTVIMILYIKHIKEVGLHINNMGIVSMVFYLMSFLGYFSFFLLAIKWPRFILKWTKMEMRFLKSPYINEKFMLRKNIKWTGLIICGLAIVEHIMFQFSSLYTFFVKMDQCNIQTNDRAQLYYMEGYPYVFDVIPFHIIIAILIQLLSITSTFIWNFMDCFIILISIGMNTRFKQIHSLLLNRQNKRFYRKNSFHQNSEEFYFQIRMDFNQVYDLLSYVDREMSFIILVSCINNLYFICYQLMNIFQTLRYYINYAYFWYSMIYLLGRTIYLFLSAANINESATYTAILLRHATSEEWNEEINRLLYRINTETIAFSGMQFFQFTRKLLLTMAGIIVTFELVILQFSWESFSKELSPLCK